MLQWSHVYLETDVHFIVKTMQVQPQFTEKVVSY